MEVAQDIDTFKHAVVIPGLLYILQFLLQRRPNLILLEERVALNEQSVIFPVSGIYELPLCLDLLVVDVPNLVAVRVKEYDFV